MARINETISQDHAPVIMFHKGSILSWDAPLGLGVITLPAPSFHLAVFSAARRFVRSLTRFISNHVEPLLGFVAFIASAIATWHIVTIKMVTALVDQNSHLNLSRQVFDSITPGISQIGYWPPLLHVLMAPVTMIDPLYHSGLAGYVVLAPALALGAIFIYRSAFLLTGHKVISAWGATILLINPFVLYYTTTSMMEVLYMGLLFGTIYYLLCWLKSEDLSHLIGSGIFLSLTTLARFEGFFAIPIWMLIIVIALWRKRKSYHEIEAVSIISGVIGMVGAMFIFIYGSIYGGNPLSFANSRWSAYNQQRDYLLPTENNIFASVQYMIHASYHVVGQPVVLFGLLCAAIILILMIQSIWKKVSPGKILPLVAVLALMLSPFLFDATALFRGNAIIYIPELPPYGVFFNERYGLYWFGFIIISITYTIGYLWQQSAANRFGHSIHVLLITTLMTGITIWSIGWTYQSIFIDNLQLVKESAQGYPSEDQAEVADFLRAHYDGGRVFMTRALHDFIAVEAHVPLREYIHESNYKYFDQVLERPWLFTRWVVMYNPQSETNSSWAQLNEKISGRYARSTEFHKYYEKVVENGRERLYRLKPAAVVEYAAAHDYDVALIPTLNESIKNWNPDTIYAELTHSAFNLANVASPYRTVATAVHAGWLPYYRQELLPQYINGYYVDTAGKGTARTQGYALLQTVAAKDEVAFDTIWNFTKQELRAGASNLIVSEFTVPDQLTRKVSIVTGDTDAGGNTDIAFALYQAGKQWKEPTYTGHADALVKDLWNSHIASAEGAFIVSSRQFEQDDEQILVHIPDLSPAAYREFAKHDKKNKWDILAEDSVRFLHRVSGPELRKNTNIFIPSEWIEVSKSDNKLILPEGSYYSADFTAQTAPLFVKLAMDVMGQTNKSTEDYLFVTNIFDDEREQGHICGEIILTDETYECIEKSDGFSAPLAVWMVKNEAAAAELVAQKYVQDLRLQIPSTDSFEAQTMHWLSLGMWAGILKP